MGQKGKIIEKQGKYIKIRLNKHSACKNCGACKLADDDSDMVITVENYIKADVGDDVEIDVDGQGIVLASIIMYLIPLISLFIGFGLGLFLSNNVLEVSGNKELLSIAMGIGFLIVSLFGIRCFDDYFKNLKIFRPVIKKIN